MWIIMNRKYSVLFLIQILLMPVTLQQEDSDAAAETARRAQNGVEPAVFSPIVTATCRAGVMTVKVETLDNFVGVVQSRDYRKPECSGYGENAKVTFLRINMLANEEDSDFCGVFSHEGNDEFSVAVAVRVHRTLETAKDKFYMITCGKAGFQNTRNETSLVNLELMQNDEKVQQVIYGRDYKLRAHFSRPDGKFGMRVQRCFSFSDTNNTVNLVDERGCPDPNIMSDFEYDNLSGVAEATLYSMFKFPDSNRVHFQCDILVCKGLCKKSNCAESIPEARSLKDPKADALLQQPEEGALMASYSVFVLEPGEKVGENYVAPVCSDCAVTDNWIFWLCVAFGFGFFLLLIIICFLLSAVTCSCVSSEVEKDKNKVLSSSSSTSGDRRKDQIVEEFDPYAKSWHGSQYGSRYSLSGVLKPMPVPYIPADNSLSSNENNKSSPPVQSSSLYSSTRPRSRSRSNQRSNPHHQRPRSKSNHRNVVQSSSSSSTQYSNANSIGRLVRAK